jgi:hypothetical protein
MKRPFLVSFFSILSLFPLAASADTLPSADLLSILQVLSPIIASLRFITFFAALLGFFWGVTTFIWNASDEKKRIQGRYAMIVSIFTLFVMVSLTGIVNVLQQTFLVKTPSTLTPPNPNLSAY